MNDNPKIVNKIAEAISLKLGRQATIRKIKNLEQYYIIDLAFSYFQKADRNRRNDYRSGYLYFMDKNDGKNCLLFNVSHSPIMFSFLLNNFNYESFRQLLIDSAKFRSSSFIEFKEKQKKQLISEVQIDKFIKSIDNIEQDGFAKTAFSKQNSTEKGIGNVFTVGIANGFKEKDVEEIINSTWELFLWLYPSKPLFNRDASLNRNLLKLEKKCEVNSIKNLSDIIKYSSCVGQIEGAHIRPHKYGGSDKMENGLWLCNKHHRLTEGKIEGQRTSTKINVKFVE